MSLFAEMLDERVLSIIGAAIGVAAYATAAQQLLRRSRERRLERRAALHAAIKKGVQTGALETVEDFVNVYKGVHELGADDISYRAGLGRTLRGYLVDLVSDGSISSESRKLLKDRVNGVLKLIEAEAPFADLPAAERNLILDIQRFVYAGDGAAVQHKLQDLAGLIEARQDAVERLQSSNKWSIPLAVIGLVLTLIFGVVSLIK